MPKGHYIRKINNGFKKGHLLGFKKGYTPYNKGKKIPNEIIKKISESMKGNKITWGNKISKSKLGKPRLDLRGNKNWNYKGGITPLRKQIRECFKYKLWISNIFTKDNFICVFCGARSGNGKAVYLEADHYPKRFSEIIKEYQIKSLEEALNCEELWNINNGRTLCKRCHRNYHKGKKIIQY